MSDAYNTFIILYIYTFNLIYTQNINYSLIILHICLFYLKYLKIGVDPVVNLK